VQRMMLDGDCIVKSGRNECKILDWISVYGQKEVQFAEG